MPDMEDWDDDIEEEDLENDNDVIIEYDDEEYDDDDWDDD